MANVNKKTQALSAMLGVALILAVTAKGGPTANIVSYK